MISTEEFATQDMKSVVDKIMRVMQDTSDSEDTSVQTNKSTSDTFKSLSMITKTKAPERQPASISPGRPLQAPPSPKFETVYTRMLAFQKRRDQELKKMQEKSEELHRLTHTHTPTLGEKTRSFAGHTSPLHNRYQLEMNLKERRRKELANKIRTVKEEELKKDLTFKPNTSRSNSNIRSAEEYYKYMKDWKESKEAIEQREREIKNEKVLDGVTFKPELDKNSKEISKNFPSFETRLEKGIRNREAKINEKKSVSPCSFQPESYTKYKKLDLEPVFQRLYPSHIKLLSSFTARSRADN